MGTTRRRAIPTHDTQVRHQHHRSTPLLPLLRITLLPRQTRHAALPTHPRAMLPIRIRLRILAARPTHRPRVLPIRTPQILQDHLRRSLPTLRPLLRRRQRRVLLRSQRLRPSQERIQRTARLRTTLRSTRTTLPSQRRRHQVTPTRPHRIRPVPHRQLTHQRRTQRIHHPHRRILTSTHQRAPHPS